MIYVVGSGPAGVSCAAALLERGVEVQMLDAGITLEAPIQSAVQKLAALAPELWDPTALTPLKTNMEARPDGLPQKVSYGSNFPYQQTEEFFPMKREKVHILASLARGGLSTVWGAAVLPHRQDEINDWPVTLKELEPHYRAALRLMPLSATKDDLEAFFPLYAEQWDDLKLSRQAQRLHDRLSLNKNGLSQQGLFFGRSRLSVHGGDEHDVKGCVYCGLCMYGCPYQYIYCSDQTLAVLKQNPRFQYLNDLIVRRVEESETGIVIYTEHRITREQRTLHGSRVFLAAGILPTTRILLESLEAYDRPLAMQYSQHFMFPLLTGRGESNLAQERLHTLSQIFLEVFDPKISPETIHLQVYTYNDLFKEAIGKSLLGSAFRLLPGLRDWTLGRVLIVQGYLHSRYSTPIQVELTRGTDKGRPCLMLKGDISSSVQKKVRQVLKKLIQTRALHGAFPFSPMLKISPPGQGFHNAGTFPMRASPGPFESDRWGRPTGFKRVHAVDATVHPSAPATTITLSVMANAHRIGATAEIS